MVPTPLPSMTSASSPAVARAVPGSPTAPGRTLDGERLLGLFAELVPVLGAALPPGAVVVLHDLSLLPDSAIAAYGDYSTSAPLAGLPSAGEDLAAVQERLLPDGRRASVATFVVQDVAGTRVAALEITTNLTPWDRLREVVDAMVGGRDLPAPAPSSPPPGLPGLPDPVIDGSSAVPGASDVLGLAHRLVEDALAETGLPVEHLKKEHKVRVVERLQERGLFLLKDAVEMSATALGVTRFTIYNYLNELGTEGDTVSPRTRKDQ
jgi:predicted transcriptional regulator YheO